MAKCEGCKYWDSYSWACCNGDSPYVADFVDEGCKEYDGCRKDVAINGLTRATTKGKTTGTT